ncbi:MAG: winged helix-turn-helix transcriptional regulator [Nitrosopumilus sp.]|nr:winged helix-turn-helix transcriptional regulator [Nitrosopumilus sp.]
MDSEPKDVIVLGAIKHGTKKFDKIQKMTQIEPEELNSILEQLERRGFIQTEEKKGWLGMKIEITVTEKGSKEVDERVHELQTKWNQMSVLYKIGDKEKLKQEMEDNKSIIPSMMFFGVMDMMMFSMMFSMMAIPMSDYVSPENMPDTGDAGMDGADGGDGGFDFDIGF